MTTQTAVRQHLHSRPLGPDLVSLTVKPREEREKTSHYASGLLGCIRRAYYEWTGAEITNPPAKLNLLKMEAGQDAADGFGRLITDHSRIHGYNAEILEAERVIELPISGLKHPIRGRLDYLFNLQVTADELRENLLRTATRGFDGAKVAVEYKSTFGGGTGRMIGRYSDSHFWDPTSGGRGEWLHGEPDLKHLAQLWAYLRSDIEADYWLLVVQDRGSKIDQSYELREDDGRLYWARVPKGLPGQYRDVSYGAWAPVPFTWEDILTRLFVVEDAVEKQEPPARHCPVEKVEYKAKLRQDGAGLVSKAPKSTDKEVYWMCHGYCDYTNLCWGLA